jgi:hypothetical protein
VYKNVERPVLHLPFGRPYRLTGWREKWTQNIEVGTRWTRNEDHRRMKFLWW